MTIPITPEQLEAEAKDFSELTYRELIHRIVDRREARMFDDMTVNSPGSVVHTDGHTWSHLVVQTMEVSFPNEED